MHMMTFHGGPFVRMYALASEMPVIACLYKDTIRTVVSAAAAISA